MLKRQKQPKQRQSGTTTTELVGRTLKRKRDIGEKNQEVENKNDQRQEKKKNKKYQV